MRVVLYSRVSTEEQSAHGYSMRQQLEALRAYAEEQGYTVAEEIADPGQSGASLERPGMDRVRDLVAAGGISLVLAQDRDRFAREPAYHYLLKREFEEHGTRIRALNDRGDESPEGELADGILDQLAKFERAKIAERTRRGKKRKASEGKVIAGRHTKYGFRLNSKRDGYELDPAKMALVKRVFEDVARGSSLKGAAATLDSENVPTPGGGKRWDRTVLKAWIMDDAYRPYSHEEVVAIVSADAARGLDPAKSYGLLRWGRRQATSRQVSEVLPDGTRRYAKRYKYRTTGPEEQIALPVPESGIPRELVDAARTMVEGNKRPAAAGDRVWELSGGIAVCAECGRSMRARRKTRRKNNKEYVYTMYRCPANETYKDGPLGCENAARPYAGPLEEKVWKEVRAYLAEPERLRADLAGLVERKKTGRRDPAAEAKHWLTQIARLDKKRAGYQEQHAEGLLRTDELRERLAGIEDTRLTAQRELGAIRGRSDELLKLQEDAEAILARYEGMAPSALDALASEERRELYAMLELKVYLDKERGIRLETPLNGGSSASAEGIWTYAPLSDRPALMLRVYIGVGGGRESHLAWASESSQFSA